MQNFHTFLIKLWLKLWLLALWFSSVFQSVTVKLSLLNKTWNITVLAHNNMLELDDTVTEITTMRTDSMTGGKGRG